MQKRLFISIKWVIIIVLAMVIPYYVGRFVGENLFGVDPSTRDSVPLALVWVAGIQITCITVVILLGFRSWVLWLLYGHSK